MDKLFELFTSSSGVASLRLSSADSSFVMFCVSKLSIFTSTTIFTYLITFRGARSMLLLSLAAKFAFRDELPWFDELKFVEVVWNVPFLAFSDQLVVRIKGLQPSSFTKPSRNFDDIKLYRIGFIAEFKYHMHRQKYSTA